MLIKALQRQYWMCEIGQSGIFFSNQDSGHRARVSLSPKPLSLPHSPFSSVIWIYFNAS